MKTTDIQVGKIYAAVSSAQRGEPFNTESRRRVGRGYRRARPTRADVNNGFDAAPIKVVAVGTFRERSSGACTREIVDDHYTTTVHVQTVDVNATMGSGAALPKGDQRIGYPHGLALDNSHIVWNDEVFQPVSLVMPWEDFLKRRAEQAFVAMEIQAYQARAEECRSRMALRVDEFLKAEHGDHQSFGWVRLGDDNEFDRVHHGEEDRATHAQVVTTTYYDLSKIEDFAALQQEYTDAAERLRCAR